MAVKTRYRLFLLFTGIVLSMQSLYSIPGKRSFFSYKEERSIVNGTVVTNLYVKGTDYKSYPDLPLALPCELSKPYDAVAIEKAFIPICGNISNPRKLYAKLLAASGYTHVKYFSVTDKKSLQMIIKSDLIGVKNAASLILTNPRVRTFSDFTTVTDNRLGKLHFKRQVEVSKRGLVLSITTSKPITQYGFEVSKAGAYQQYYFFFYDKKRKGFCYYGIHALRFTNGLFLQLGFKPASIGNRLRAMTVYFSGICAGKSPFPLAAYRK